MITRLNIEKYTGTATIEGESIFNKSRVIS